MRNITLTWTRRAAQATAVLMGGFGLLFGSAAYGQTIPVVAEPAIANQNNDAIYEQAAARLQETLAPAAEGSLTSEVSLTSGEAGCAPACESSCCDSCCNSCCECESSWCDLGEPCDLGDKIFGECSDWDIGGWTQWGYHSEANGLFNKHPHKVQNHQSWLYLEKVADGSCGMDWGFRADIMYGVDAADTQAFGNPPGSWDFANGWDHGIYGFAMPQLYAEIASGDWSIKAGHFFTLIGYEVVTAPDNFFYSHAYTMYNSEPFTHSGVLATYAASENVEVYGGWTAGWDSGFDSFMDGSNFLGGASLTLSDEATFTYITTIGDFGWRGEGYSHSLVLDLALSDEVNYVIQSDLVETNAGADHQYGLNQYLFYAFNDCLKAGLRGEWWKNGDNSQYEVTAGINYRATANLIVRPEVRHDWNPGGQNIVGKNDYTTFGVDAILTF